MTVRFYCDLFVPSISNRLRGFPFHFWRVSKGNDISLKVEQTNESSHIAFKTAARTARQSALTDADIFILSKNDKLKLLGAVRYVQCRIYASRNLVFTGVNLVSSSGNKKVRVPPIEQHPLQIRQRPVQKAQSQQKNCLLLHHSALIAGASARQLRRLGELFSSHYRKMFLPQTLADVQMHP